MRRTVPIFLTLCAPFFAIFCFAQNEAQTNPPGKDIVRIVFERLKNTVPRSEWDMDIFRVDSDGSGEKQLTTDGKSERPATSPDGNAIAYVRCLHACDRPKDYAIFVMNPDGGNSHLLTPISGSVAISWSPDGAALAYFGSFGFWDGPGSFGFAFSRITQPSSLLLLSASPRPRTLDIEAEGRDGLTWSPDGKWVVFPCSRAKGQELILSDACVTATAQDAKVTKLPEPAVLGEYAWSPQTAEVAYVVEKGKSSALYVAATDSGEARLLIQVDGPVFGLQWSPGRKILFVTKESKEKGYSRLCEVNEDGTNKVCPIDRELEIASAPMWSPDGEEIVFTAKAHGNVLPPTMLRSNWEVYAMNADGSNVRILTQDKRLDCQNSAWVVGSMVLARCGEPMSDRSWIYLIDAHKPTWPAQLLAQGPIYWFSFAALPPK